MNEENAVHLEVWGAGDFPLLELLMGDPAMTEHLGGPESSEKLVERQQRYEALADSPTDRMFKIVDEDLANPAARSGSGFASGRTSRSMRSDGR